ncbi:MAG: hypothetical protein ABIL74_09915 [candidate division WOR-3 bacterium]
MVILFIFIGKLISDLDTAFWFDSVYYNYSPVEVDSELSSERLFTPVAAEGESSYSSALKISGVKEFSFSIDEGFNQGLKLYVTGEVEGVQVKGTLADEGADIPTRRISEIEKMRLEAWTKNFYGGIGDLNLILPFGVADEISGIRLGVAQKENNINFSYALKRGQYRRVEFTGEECKQGPYFLGGRVVYGSEKVHLSDQLHPAKLLVVNMDYEIDYEQGILNFTNKNIITRNSHIIVEYQEAVENYPNIYQEFDGQYRIGELQFNGLFHRSLDDYSNPLGFRLTPSELESLKICGDSAWVRHIYADTSTSGNYDLVDGHFVYVGEGEGNYRVSFFYVGENNGEYVYDASLKGFVYRGPGMGNYTPEKFIPLPRDNQFYALGLDYASAISLSFYTSRVDQNRFSSRDDEDNQQYGYELNLSKKWGIFSVSSRYIDYAPKLYQPKGRQVVNHYYEWQSVEILHELFQVQTGIALVKDLALELGYGVLNRTHQKRSIYLRPFFLYVGYEEIDTLNKYMAGMREKTGRWTVYSQYLYQEAEHFTDYGLYYTLFGEKTIGISGSYERCRATRAFLTRMELLTRPLNMSLGVRDFNDTTLLFGNVNMSMYLKNFRINGEVEQSQRYIQKKDEVYIKVAPGKGNYVYDPITRTYIPKEGGDYIKQIILLPEFQRVVSRKCNLEPAFATDMFDSRLRLYYTDEKNFYNRVEDLTLNFQKDDEQLEINLKEDFVRDGRYALEMVILRQYFFSINPMYKKLNNYFATNYQSEEWGEFLKARRIDYETEIDLEIRERPQIKPFTGYKYSKAFSDFFPGLMVVSQTPKLGLLIGLPIRRQGRVETTVEFLYRQYNIEDVPYLFSVNEPPGPTSVGTLSSTIGIGNNTIFSLVYRLQYHFGAEIIHNLKLQAKIRF